MTPLAYNRTGCFVFLTIFFDWHVKSHEGTYQHAVDSYHSRLLSIEAQVLPSPSPSAALSLTLSPPLYISLLLDMTFWHMMFILITTFLFYLFTSQFIVPSIYLSPVLT